MYCFKDCEINPFSSHSTCKLIFALEG